MAGKERKRFLGVLKAGAREEGAQRCVNHRGERERGARMR